jgi:hypothetical protein
MKREKKREREREREARGREGLGEIWVRILAREIQA